MSKIKWQLIQVKASEIKGTPNNPKKRNDKGFKRLQKSVEKYGLIFAGIANKDLQLLDGNSRLELLNPNEEVAVFVPDKQLNEKQAKELNAIYDLARAGDSDHEILEETFDDEFFEEWELEKARELEPKKIELKPYKKTHILLSFPPERMMDIQKLVEKISKFPDVEIEQAAN